MVWGCMSANGVGNLVIIVGIMDQYVYRNILEANVLQSAEKLGLAEGFIFQQDNDPKHTSKYAKKFFEEAYVELLDWVNRSPDLNPMENLWRKVKVELNKKTRSNIEQRKAQILEVWHSISPEFLTKLVKSMPKRLKKVILQKGSPLGY